MSIGRRLAAWELKKRNEDREFGALKSYFWDKHIKRLWKMRSTLEKLNVSEPEIKEKILLNCRYTNSLY